LGITILMGNTKIMIYGISHLTDARYFAAMGAEWLCFIIDDSGKEGIPASLALEFMYWVSGPRIVLDLSPTPAEDRDKIYRLMGADTVIIRDAHEMDTLPAAIQSVFLWHNTALDWQDWLCVWPVSKRQRIARHIVTYMPSEIQIIKDMVVSGMETPLLYSAEKSNFESILKTYHPPGIALTGTVLQEVGVQNYTDWEHIWEYCDI